MDTVNSKSALTKMQGVLLVAIVIIAAIVGVAYYWMTRPQPEIIGGTLVIAGTRDADSLDPTRGSLGFEISSVEKAIYDSLVFIDPNNLTRILPMLATSWERPDNVTYILHLREGVKFHDGTPFNASCLLFMDQFIRRNESLLDKAEWIANVKTVEALDNYTVKYNLLKPYVLFIVKLSKNWGWIPSPSAVAKWGEEYGNHPVGTGPFKFLAWNRDVEIILEANNDYWQGRPPIDKLILKHVSEDAVRVMEIQSGTVDIMELPLRLGKSLEESGKVNIYETGSDRHYLLVVPVDYVDPDWQYNSDGVFLNFSDVRVRQAINYAINPQEIITTVIDGFGKVPVGMCRYGMPGYAPELAKYQQNVTKAKELLAAAGYPNGFKCTLQVQSKATGPSPYEEPAAVVLQQQLKAAGIDVEIIVRGTEMSDYCFFQKFHLILRAWRGGATAHQILEVYHSQTSGPGRGKWNQWAVRRPYLDNLITQMNAIPVENVAKWKPITDEIQRYEIENALVIPYMDRLGLTCAAKRVQGYTGDATIGADVYNPLAGVIVRIKD